MTTLARPTELYRPIEDGKKKANHLTAVILNPSAACVEISFMGRQAILTRKVLAGIPALVEQDLPKADFAMRLGCKESRYRQEAEQCLQLAERTRTQIDKEAWLRLATDWVRLAEAAEKERPPRSGEK
jgi:hypothetical protein